MPAPGARLGATVRGGAKTLIAGLVLAMGLQTACDAEPKPAEKRGSAEPAGKGESRPELREVILAWLECEECGAGELQAVTERGPGAVPLLIATLKHGISPARRARLELQLRERFSRLEAYRERHPDRPEVIPELTFEEFVAHHVSSSRYRGRAALALGRIATPDAEAALRENRNVEHLPSVAKAIRDALRMIDVSRQGS
jgi:hypothetical protein